MKMKNMLAAAVAASALTGVSGGTAAADQVFFDDVIIQSSLCVGNDCVNGESFGFDTLRLKENNLRINFQDTSVASSFPSNDWRIVANDSSNGGENYLAIEDSSAGRIPFRVEAGAPSHSLYVEADGDVGIKTRDPVVDLHIVEGNTPTVRLQQDGSDGFTPQTWDIAGNEANFFIRDVTNGSQLPFKIRPGADDNSLYIAADNRVGLGTASPAAHLDIRSTATTRGSGGSTNAASLRILADTGPALMTFEPNANNRDDFWLAQATGNGAFFRISKGDSGNQEFTLDSAGNLQLHGGLTTGGDVNITGTVTTTGPTCSGGCDAVFEADYDLPSIEAHAEYMFSNRHLQYVGPTAEDGSPVNLTEKMGGMLTHLEYAHIYIARLHDEQAQTRQEMAALIARLERLEAGSDAE